MAQYNKQLNKFHAKAEKLEAHKDKKYHDYFRIQDMVPGCTHMSGTDELGRKFIVFKCTVGDKFFLPTLQERYTGNHKHWNICGNFPLCTTGGMTDDQFEFMVDLLSGLEPDIEDRHRPNWNKDIGNTVKLSNLDGDDLIHNDDGTLTVMR